MSKKIEKELSPRAGTIREKLVEIHTYGNAMQELVEELEGNVSYKGLEKKDFYEMYIIVLLEQFCTDENERELMFAQYHLLQDFTYNPELTLEDDAIRYWKCSRNCNSILKNINTPGSAYKTIRARKSKIIDNLSINIDKAIDKSNGKLNLTKYIPRRADFPSLRKNPGDKLKKITIKPPLKKKLLQPSKINQKHKKIDEILKSILDHRYDLLELPFDVLSRFNESISTSEGLRKVVENAGKDIVCLFLLILALYYLNKPLLDKTDSPRVTYTDSYDSLGNMNYGGSIKEPIISVSLRDKIHIGK